MKIYLRYSLTIALFAASSGLLLSLVNQATRNQIQDQQVATENLAQKQVLPQAVSFTSSTNQGVNFKIGFDADNVTVGYVLKTRIGGYSSTIETLVGLDNELVITGVKIISQQETPGLGTKITEIKADDNESWFQKQFRNKKHKKLFLKKNGGSLDGITGATVSSQAVITSVRQAIVDFEAAFK